MPGIEAWLPRYDVGERHEIDLALPLSEALKRALATPAAPDRLIDLLFRLRGLAPDGTIEQFMASNGFTLLERTETSYVVGLIARGRRIDLAGPDEWRTGVFPDSVKIAADFRAEPGPKGTRLITETRVVANSRRSLVTFRLYWLVVGPFSKLIRRRWLRAAAASVPSA